MSEIVALGGLALLGLALIEAERRFGRAGR
jgi:hypothetical protein